ncbi:MAG: histidinol dehydrogenase [Pseudomonadales bacterium]|jgi:histidinol dehydrogenase|nr:histidinol dehydrogenase [Pseudomonadales bacterium]
MSAPSQLPRRLDARDGGFAAALDQLLSWDTSEDAELTRTVRAIIERVRSEGDAAVLDFTRRFDALEAASLAELEVSAEVLAEAHGAIGATEREALELAAARIRAYHERQRSGSWDYEDELGNRLGQRVTPLDRVGLYVPGGKASYPSSVLMTAVPASVAGVREIVMTAPTPGGEINPLVLAAAHLAGVHRVFRIGGAQAVAALAFGTETVPRVDKIVGPGGAFVAEAKRQVFGPVGIDMIAGPSEILVVADAGADPEWLALDLFSQAEHDEAAQAILISADEAVLDAVAAAIERLLPTQPRAEVIRRSLGDRGALIRVADLDQAVALINRIAPEHLELAVADPDALLPAIRHAGAVFLGYHTPEALGDYVAGPSHVLPTFGTARFSSPLGVYDFEKRSSIIGCSPSGAAVLGRAAAVLAEGEGLGAHARSAGRRVPGYDDNEAASG